MENRIASLSEDILEKITLIRHDIHQHPEIAYQESRTAETIETFLDESDIPHERCTDTGIVSVIGSGSGHVVGLRSDMDALSMPDLSGLPYASVNEGVAHACGHDGHIAILLGTAWVLKQLEGELSGTVKLIWQPAEEGGAGAEKMIRHGVLQSPAPEAIFALHGWPGLPVGKAAFRFGSALAAVDNFKIIVRGKGTHGAMPHAGVDPITIAARIIEGFQLIRSRMINPLDPIVISVGTIHGGSAVNVIPDEVTMTGTIRCLDRDTRCKIPVLMDRMAVETARASGGNATFTITDGYPPTINEERATAFARDVLCEILGMENVIEITQPVMGGEDFAYYLEKISGSFIRLGIGDRPALHNSSFDFNDDAIPFGIRMMTGIALNFLAKGLA
ncbi:MAG: amidohydrolase [Candidatus Latescibacteria bacterium]|jgi:amidohydrolase|nr:amidohydrolase [Candidatus Latescibacterota bacterium]